MIKYWVGQKLHSSFCKILWGNLNQLFGQPNIWKGASQVAASGKEPSCQCRRLKRCGFDPWVGKIPWKRAWQPSPAFLPGESHGHWSLAGYSPWGHKESDTTERLHFFFFLTQDNTGKEILRNTVPSLTELAQQKQHTWLVYSAESFFQMALLHEEVFYWFHKPRWSFANTLVLQQTNLNTSFGREFGFSLEYQK